MLGNLGAKDPTLRDGLIYPFFTLSIEEEALSEGRFLYFAQALIDRELTFYRLDEATPSVLTRSFSALQAANIVEADGKTAGSYFHLLSPEMRQIYFDQALLYLEKEHVFEGYSEEYGWLHTFAHGADYLACALVHPDFPRDMTDQVLKVLERVFFRLPFAFKQGEERRLGGVIELGILSGNFSQAQVASWLKNLKFPLEKNIDFIRLANFEIFLAYIYFHLFEKIDMEEELQDQLLSVLRKI